MSVLGLLLAAGGLVLFERWPERRQLTRLDGPAALSVTAADNYRSVGYLPRLSTVYAGAKGRVYGIEDHFVYRSDDDGRSFERLGVLPDTRHGLWTAATEIV